MDFAILLAKTNFMPPHKMELCGQILREKVANLFAQDPASPALCP